MCRQLMWGLRASLVAQLAAGVVLPVRSAVPFTPTTGAELEQAVTDAKAAWTSTSERQEIVLAKGKYEISNELFLNFPVVLRGATGNPADVTVKHLNTGSNKFRVMTVDDPDAMLHSVTLTGGRLNSWKDHYNRIGACIRVSKTFVGTDDGKGTDASRNYGAGGIVSNCVFTGNVIDYKNNSAIVYVNGPADKTLVTCCVVTNNTVTRQTDSSTGNSALGSIVHVDSGRFTSSIVRGNTADNSNAGTKQDLTSIVEARGGSVENCLVIRNRISYTFDPTVVRTLNAGKVCNTVIADNTITLNDWSRADRPASSDWWAGVASGFVNSVMKGTDVVLPNATCICTNDLGYLEESADDYRLSRFSVQRAAAEMTGVLTTGADLLGKPRVNASGLLDIGPIAYDPDLVKVAGVADAGCFEDEEVVFRVTSDEGYGDDPTYYWTLTPKSGGASVTFETKSTVFSTPLPAGVYETTLTVSNLTAGTGGSVRLSQDAQSHQRTFYAKAGNPGAAAPYATAETAAADIQTAIDAVTADGATVIVGKGRYEIQSNLMVRARQIVLRGATGKPEDVVVRNTTTKKWNASHWDEQYGYGEGRCLVLDAGPAARVEAMTFENGQGLYSVHIGCGLYLGSWTRRTTWPNAGKGGTVSNCVVRNCTANSCKYGIAPGIFARGPYLITHTVITNCSSGTGNSDGGRFCGVGLDLGGGARAEHCLIADNSTRTYWESGKPYPTYGRVTVGGAVVRDSSVLRFSTVVNNGGALVGGVNVVGTSARVENSIILGNWAGESLACETTTNRFNCWAMMSWTTDSDLISGTTAWAQGNLAVIASNEIAYVEAHPEAVDAAFVNTITDYAAAGTTGMLSSKADVFRNAAKRDYRLRGTSPGCDRVAPTAAGTMPSVDLLGQPRLSGGLYDYGCYERQIRGFLLKIE